MKQTAVEWLVKEIPNMHWEDPYWADLFERAKEMEKQQIIDAWGESRSGLEYYNRKYKK